MSGVECGVRADSIMGIIPALPDRSQCCVMLADGQHLTFDEGADEACGRWWAVLTEPSLEQEEEEETTGDENE
jgi:hypothetical protein